MSLFPCQWFTQQQVVPYFPRNAVIRALSLLFEELIQGANSCFPLWWSFYIKRKISPYRVPGSLTLLIRVSQSKGGTQNVKHSNPYGFQENSHLYLQTISSLKLFLVSKTHWRVMSAPNFFNSLLLRIVLVGDHSPPVSRARGRSSRARFTASGISGSSRHRNTLVLLHASHVSLKI